MSRDLLGDMFGALATDRQEAARVALRQVAGRRSISSLSSVSGGASGAAIFRAEIEGRSYLLRVEGPELPGLPRNPHRHECARLAAEAGIAPAIRHLDETSGVMVTDFVEAQPLEAFPGGELALARALGELVHRVQSGPAFPPLVDYLELMERRLAGLVTSGRFVAGALDPHGERLAAIRLARQEEPPSLAPSHNDPNRGNILFDGQRLWLIDWESAYRNDPFVDVAIMLDSLASGPAFEAGLLEAWLGRAPNATDRRRLELARSLARLYMACFLLDIGPPAAAAAAIDALDPADVLGAIIAGRLAPGTPETAQALGRIYLSGFLTGAAVPGLAAAVSAAMGLPKASWDPPA